MGIFMMTILQDQITQKRLNYKPCYTKVPMKLCLRMSKSTIISIK